LPWANNGTAIIWGTLANAGYIPQVTGDRSCQNQRTQASSWSHVV
jgi:hypothetical protein